MQNLYIEKKQISLFGKIKGYFQIPLDKQISFNQCKISDNQQWIVIYGNYNSIENNKFKTALKLLKKIENEYQVNSFFTFQTQNLKHQFCFSSQYSVFATFEDGDLNLKYAVINLNNNCQINYYKSNQYILTSKYTCIDNDKFIVIEKNFNLHIIKMNSIQLEKIINIFNQMYIYQRSVDLKYCKLNNSLSIFGQLIHNHYKLLTYSINNFKYLNQQNREYYYIYYTDRQLKHFQLDMIYGLNYTIISKWMLKILRKIKIYQTDQAFITNNSFILITKNIQYGEENTIKRTIINMLNFEKQEISEFNNIPNLFQLNQNVIGSLVQQKDYYEILIFE